MRAISLWQPWASAIAIGAKAVETRHWRSPFRGLVAIHAAKRWTLAEREFTDAMRRSGEPLPASLPLGAIVAVCKLTAVTRTEELLPRIDAREVSWGNFGPGRFGWSLEEVSALAEPIATRGQQGFWELDDETTARVLASAGGVLPEPAPVTRWELPL